MSNEDSKTLMDEILMSGKKKIHSISNSEIEKADEFCEPYKDFLINQEQKEKLLLKQLLRLKKTVLKNMILTELTLPVIRFIL